MSRNKALKRKLPASGESSPTSEVHHPSPSHSRRNAARATHQWTTGHLVGALVLGLAVGVGIGLSFGGGSEPERVNTVATTGAPGSLTPVSGPPPTSTVGPQTALDAYGRPPSDPHYGHNHP